MSPTHLTIRRLRQVPNGDVTKLEVEENIKTIPYADCTRWRSYAQTVAAVRVRTPVERRARDLERVL